jgi:hypothetical protein
MYTQGHRNSKILLEVGQISCFSTFEVSRRHLFDETIQVTLRGLKAGNTRSSCKYFQSNIDDGEKCLRPQGEGVCVCNPFIGPIENVSVGEDSIANANLGLVKDG